MDTSQPSRFKRKRSALPGKTLALEKETYLITLTLKEDAPVLGSIKGKAFAPNERGRTILTCWRDMAHIRPDLQTDAVRIGPRHLQGLLSLAPSENESFSLGQAIRLVKAYTSMCLARISPKKNGTWKSGYSERQVLKAAELSAARQALKSPVSE